MFEFLMWSSPSATGTYPAVNPISSPNEPVFFGPAIKIAELYPSPLPDGCSYIHLLLNESQSNEPLTPAFEPESCTLTPPNLTAGVAVFKITLFVPISTADAVIFCKDDEPCTTKLFVIYNEPVIVWLP